MFLPIRTDRSLRHTPWVNYALIAANVLIFIATTADLKKVFYLMGEGMPLDQLAKTLPVGLYMLVPSHLSIEQFISYQFLHADWMHLLGNMLFLYVFGNSVEDRLGKVAYLLFYLAGGVVAGLGHALIEQATPVLGASGAVAAVSGAYLALFPRSNVTILYIYFFIGTFEISSMLLILFQIAQDAFLYVGQFGGVAYLAHLSGYAYGFAIGIGLLWIKLLTREPYDMLSLLEQKRRRAQFQALTRKGYQPWQHQADSSVNPDRPSSSDSNPQEAKLIELRAKISSAISDHRLDDAAKLYLELLTVDPTQVLARQQQLDLANQLMSSGRYEQAAAAYELFLSAYKNYGQREQVELILGLICGRYLRKYERSKQLLTSALARLTDPDERALAQQVIEEIASKTG